MVDLKRKAFDESTTYAAYKREDVYKCTPENILQTLKEILQSKPNERVLIELPSTVGLTDGIISSLTDNIDVRIIGGLTEEYSRSHKNEHMDYLREKATYSKQELQDIMARIKAIEENIDPKWNDYEKALYLYEYVKYDVVYREPGDVADSFGNRNRTRTWDTLTGLSNHLSTCSGFAHIYQELCTRQNISCVKTGGNYVKDRAGDHAWNIITIDGKNYIVDIVWDAIDFEKGKDVTTGFAPKEVSGYRSGIYQDLQRNLHSIDPNWVQETAKKVSERIPKVQMANERIENFKEIKEADRQRMMYLRGEQLSEIDNQERRTLS